MLLQVPGVAAAVVDTYEPAPGTVELVGYYSLRAGTGDRWTRTRSPRTLRERLPPYMVPAYLEQLDAIPMTPQRQGRPQERCPPPSAAARPAAGAASTSPPASDDRAGCWPTRWPRTLGLDTVSVDSHFFDDLGANSLLMAQFSRAGAQGDRRCPSLSMREVYGTRRSAQLADAARRRRPGRGHRRRRRDRHRGARPAPPATGCAAPLQLLTLPRLALPRRAAAGDRAHLGRRRRRPALEVGLRSALFGVGHASLAACLLPIVAKWLLIGRWQAARDPAVEPRATSGSGWSRR